MLTVHGEIQRDWGSILPGTSTRQEHRWPVLAREIARDIVGEWSGVTIVGRGMTTNCHPGVWVVRDTVPVTERRLIENPDGQKVIREDLLKDASGAITFREANATEFATMWDEDLRSNREADRHYAEWCWVDGNRISNDNKFNQLIPANYRLAAKHYDLEASWLKEAAAADSRSCPNCGRPGSKHTFVCGYCQQPTDLARWAAWQAEKDAALRDAKQTGGKLPPPAAPQRQPLAA